MVDKAKYVIINGRIVVFGEGLPHSTFKNMNPTSAGFIVIDRNENNEVKARCFGESESLGIKSNPTEDSARANYELGLNFLNYMK